MALIPNPDVDYDAWIARAHQVKALALDEAEGEAAFDEWSQKSGKYDADETARRWATVRPSRTAGMTLLADAEAADPEGFARIMNKEAGSAFDDDAEPPPAPPAGGGGGGGGLTHVDMAENIIRRERGTLGWMSNASSRWAGFDPVMGRWVMEDHDALMRAAVRDEVHAARLAAVEPKDARRMAEAKWRGAVQGLMMRERRLMLPFDGFDADLDTFGVPGGVVRLGLGGIVEEGGAAGQMVSKAMAVRPAPRGARGVAWEDVPRRLHDGRP